MESMKKYSLLIDYMQNIDSVLVAFSGGVDSLLLLAAAVEALGREKVLAVTAVSAIHPPEEKEEAKELAAFWGARWLEVESREMENPYFLANPPDRCYHCKKGLLELLSGIASREGLAWMAEGSNRSDLDDYRPGYRAVKESGVLSPLLEAGITKADVREILKTKGVSGWDKPSDACLCSRIPYGVAVTGDILKRVYLAEKVIKDFGVSVVRVRDHGDTARLEVLPKNIETICREDNRAVIVQKLKSLGYKHVAIDMQGYRTGSMN